MKTKELLYWIAEREKIRIAREAGKPKPWSKILIMQHTRFCNIRREDDRVTRWIAEHWRTPHASDPDLWFAIVVARLFNLPETLQAIGYPTAWRIWKPYATEVLKVTKKNGFKIFNPAYIVSTNGYTMGKVPYLFEYVLAPLWEDRELLRPEHGDFLCDYAIKLSTYNGLGSFMGGQVIADLKYVEPLRKAPDWWTWAAPGPGSMRGLNIVCGREIDAPWKPSDFLATLNELQAKVVWPLEKAGVKRLHAQDLQNCLCEFSKYYKIKNGLGRAKSGYPGAL